MAVEAEILDRARDALSMEEFALAVIEDTAPEAYIAGCKAILAAWRAALAGEPREPKTP